MRLVLTRVEAKILYDFLSGKKLKSFREYAMLNDVVARLKRGLENEQDEISGSKNDYQRLENG